MCHSLSPPGHYTVFPEIPFCALMGNIKEKKRKYKQKGLEVMAGGDRVAACLVCASIMSKRGELKKEPFIVESKKLDLIF